MMMFFAILLLREQCSVWNHSAAVRRGADGPKDRPRFKLNFPAGDENLIRRISSHGREQEEVEEEETRQEEGGVISQRCERSQPDRVTREIPQRCFA
jgi:hypothetical protein